MDRDVILGKKANFQGKGERDRGIKNWNPKSGNEMRSLKRNREEKKAGRGSGTGREKAVLKGKGLRPLEDSRGTKMIQ